MRDNPGVDGDKLAREAFEQAARGGGWVDYDFANPQTGSVDLKTSYVEPITPDLLFGCGVFKQRSAVTTAQLDGPPAPSHRRQSASGGRAAARCLNRNLIRYSSAASERRAMLESCALRRAQSSSWSSPILPTLK